MLVLLQIDPDDVAFTIDLGRADFEPELVHSDRSALGKFPSLQILVETDRVLAAQVQSKTQLELEKLPAHLEEVGF